MKALPVVLDAGGLDALCEPRPPVQFRALLEQAWNQGREVLVPAVVCAEVCRGVSHTRRVEAAVARYDTVRGHRPPVRLVSTDFTLARQVGAVLHSTGSGTEDIVDAHVVATCALYGGGLVITADSDDIQRLATAVPSVRIVTRSAR
jgi:predicted nucleic acid-binding protein